MSRLLGDEGTKADLDKWLTYLNGNPNRCKCDYEWATLGALQGKGWVRITTHPECPIHALCQGYTPGVEAAYKKEHPWSIGRWCPVHTNKGCPSLGEPAP